jgi:hypothetical protein
MCGRDYLAGVGVLVHRNRLWSTSSSSSSSCHHDNEIIRFGRQVTLSHTVFHLFELF